MALRRRSRKLADLEIVEASGVDHPAHLHEGWLVQKDALAVALDEVATLDTTDQGEEMDLETEIVDAPVEDVDTVAVEVAAEPAAEAVDVRKQLEHLAKELADAKSKAAALEDEREIEKATTRAADWGILPELAPAEFAPVLRSLRANAPDETAEVEKILDACTAALSEAGIFKELGSDADSDAGAWDQITALAKAKVESGSVATMPAAITAVAVENPDLHARYMTEKDGS